ncbi:MAG: hypothetical protein HUJ97_00970 [Bacteroidales bacterium]|nr:hypothetical protein [Bacteroidales bacterium]
MKYLSFFFLSLFLLISCQQNKVIKVACVGDSITEGFGLEHPGSDAYPAVLQSLLGEKYDVKNFGMSAHTMMNKGNLPYMHLNMERARFQDALEFCPDIVTIMLGTNDSKEYNWETNKEDFAPSMNAMIDSFLCLPSHPEIYICLPIPVAEFAYDIRPDVVDNEICPLVKKIAEERGLKVIDLNSAFRSQLSTLEDFVHPNKDGARFLAEKIADALNGK